MQNLMTTDGATDTIDEEPEINPDLTADLKPGPFS